MNDPTKLSNIRTGQTVKIKLASNPNEYSVGEIYKVVSKTDDPQGIFVNLDNGEVGNVDEVINSSEIIKKRILSETHNSENKGSFYEHIMRIDEIPKTIQSFLNSDGGYLNIGIYDGGSTPEEKIIGLDKDRKVIESRLRPGETLSDGKFKDELWSDIEDTLDKYLKSDVLRGPLLDHDFPVIDGVMFLEINVKRSPAPFFYKNLSRNNKEINYEICLDNKIITKRRLDGFYVRNGSRKIPMETFEEFQSYFKEHFQ